MIPQPYQLPAIILLIVGGVIAWSAGYRLFRLVLTLYGFILGALVGTSILGSSDTMYLVLGALGGGAVGALIMFFGYFVGVALVGAGIGALAVHLWWSRLGTDPHPFVVIFAAVAGAASAMALQRYVIIVSTAFGGAWTLLLGGLSLTEYGKRLAGRPEVWIVYPLDPSPHRMAVVGAWCVLGLLGVMVQLRYTGMVKAKVKSKK
ncbi:MAG: DUF4203 domain-containing protein [Vicinamibacterales bacterium]|nr:DUF4203 domain-containing protein [Vicinamibacterales bacterium]